MKLSILLTFVFTVNMMASVYSQEARFDLDIKDQTVRDVLKNIEDQSKFRFFYNDEFTDLNRTVSITTNDKSIDDLLSLILDNTTVTYKVMDNNFVVITPKSLLQQTKVTGNVTDASTGESLPGVNIQIEGSQAGTVSDANGKYSLEVAPNASLIFSYVGYNTQKIEVNGRSIIDIAMGPDIQMLDEVVVVGYGTMKRKDVTGSVASVQTSEFEHQIINTPAQILKGRAAGVAVTTVSGAPGGDYKIRIRGANSLLGSNDPLLVVDGIQGGISLKDINPNDIESMDILKDASSTAIYGSRGANGVILITTKQGKEGRAIVELNSYLSFKNGQNPYTMMDPVLYAETVNLGTPGAYSQDQINALQGTAPVDCYDEMLQKGILQNYEVSVRGGSKMTQYSLSGGIQSEDGAVVNTNLKRYLFRSNISTQISNKVICWFEPYRNPK